MKWKTAPKGNVLCCRSLWPKAEFGSHSHHNETLFKMKCFIFSLAIFSSVDHLFYCKNWCTTSITYNTRVISWQLIDVNPLACNLSLVKLLFFQTAQQQAGYEFWHFSIISPCKQLRHYYILQTCISKGVWVDKLICK